MDRALLIALAAAVLSLLALLLSTVLTSRTRRRLTAAEDQVAALQDRLDELSARVPGDAVDAQATPAAQATRTPGAADPDRNAADSRGTASPSAEFVITSLSDPAVGPVAAPAHQGPDGPSGREFATVALGESLVRVLALGHGVRRAMSAENRNRIAFEMQREVKRARRQRRRDVREARRYLRNGGRPETTAEATGDMTAGLRGDAA
jgi:hypothetical protein